MAVQIATDPLQVSYNVNFFKTLFFNADIYNTKYGGGGVVSREETTGLGAVKGYGTTGITGYDTATGYGTTGRTKETYGGTIKEYRESGVNMAFLDSYFSEVTHVCLFLI